MTGNVRIDDLSIPNNTRLFRRVAPNQLSTLNDGSVRPSSSVFKTTEMSVNIESLMLQQGRPPEDTVSKYPGHFLVAVVASTVREHKHPIVIDTEGDADPAHGLVLGKKRNAFIKTMLNTYQWVLRP